MAVIDEANWLQPSVTETLPTALFKGLHKLKGAYGKRKC